MTKILSQSEVAAIRECAAKATPGWRARDLGNGSFAIDMSADGCRNDVWREGMTSHFNIVEGAGKPNAEFAAAARADVPALCDTVDALRAKLEVAKAALESCKAALGDNMRSQGLGGKGITRDYARAVVGEINSALASLKEPQ